MNLRSWASQRLFLDTKQASLQKIVYRALATLPKCIHQLPKILSFFKLAPLIFRNLDYLFIA